MVNDHADDHVLSGWYRGDCHVHSTLSHGGELSTAQLAAAAREAGLDFLAITEHNSCDTHPEWAALGGGDLLMVLGQEVTTLTGHWLALGIEPLQVVDWRYGVRDGVIDRHLEQVRRDGGLGVAAHPHAPYPSGLFGYPLEKFDAVEVWNGLWASDLPWNADNEAALAEWGRGLAHGVHCGRWVPAIGNSDTHLAGQMGSPHTVVRAGELSVAAILAGLRAGRSWLAESASIELSFEVAAAGRVAGIGESLATEGNPAVAQISVSGVPSGTVSLHTERGKAHQETLPASGSGAVRWQTTQAQTTFLRAEVRHPNGHMAALTNPILLA